VPRKYRITRRIWRVRHWRVSILGSVAGCTTGHGLELWGYDPPFVALGRWWHTRKGSCPNTSNRNLWQMTLPLTFSLPAASLTKTMFPGNYHNICEILAVTCETGAEIKKPWLE
jgi:hypothetical protein